MQFAEIGPLYSSLVPGDKARLCLKEKRKKEKKEKEKERKRLKGIDGLLHLGYIITKEIVP